MKNLEKIIVENRDHFDSFEPDDGHFDRFEKRLKKRRYLIIDISFQNMIKIAAIVVFVVLSGFWIYYQGQLSVSGSSGYALSDVSKEFQEVEFYYTSQVNEKYLTIENSTVVDSTQKSILLNEINEMDKMYENLKKDLKENPNDERIVNAMIQHYQVKVDVMNQIIKQLEEVSNVKKQKPNNYENTKI